MDYVRMVFVSCNVDSLIEQPKLISRWCEVVSKEIIEQKSQFVAIHLQGLRTKGKGAVIADNLIKYLDDLISLDIFENSRTFYDLENLGLCSIYYMTNDVRAALFDNKKQEYWEIGGRQTDTPGSSTLRKERLGDGYNLTAAQEPASFMLSRWLLFGFRPFTFVNLSLTCDQSPLEGCLQWPSDSSRERRKELQSLLDGLNLFDDDAVLFVGNLNSGLNKEKLLKDQLDHNHAVAMDKTDDYGNLCKFEALNFDGKKVFEVDFTKFDFGDMHEWLFGTCNGQLVKKYDQELADFKTTLCEPGLYFGPNYPYQWDDKKEADYFSRNDCPGWKNRILMNKKAWDMMHHDSFACSGMYYRIIGKGANIGAYKPVILVATVCLK